jgi:hypothetical protein
MLWPNRANGSAKALRGADLLAGVEAGLQVAEGQDAEFHEVCRAFQLLIAGAARR